MFVLILQSYSFIVISVYLWMSLNSILEPLRLVLSQIHGVVTYQLVKLTVSGTTVYRFSFHGCRLQPVWPWASHVTSVHLAFTFVNLDNNSTYSESCDKDQSSFRSNTRGTRMSLWHLSPTEESAAITMFVTPWSCSLVQGIWRLLSSSLLKAIHCNILSRIVRLEGFRMVWPGMLLDVESIQLNISYNCLLGSTKISVLR